jgi:hypothetical protein
MLFKLLLSPVRLTAASVRGIAWTRGAFGRRRPRVVVRPTRTVVVRRWSSCPFPLARS